MQQEDTREIIKIVRVKEGSTLGALSTLGEKCLMSVREALSPDTFVALFSSTVQLAICCKCTL